MSIAYSWVAVVLASFDEAMKAYPKLPETHERIPMWSVQECQLHDRMNEDQEKAARHERAIAEHLAWAAPDKLPKCDFNRILATQAHILHAYDRCIIEDGVFYLKWPWEK